MSDVSPSKVTQILVALQSGEIDHRDATDGLFDLTYQELRRLASDLMRRERATHTLQATALVHEAYLRLVDSTKIEWESRAHFFGTAARAMRQLLVDHARRRMAAKRQGDWERITLDPSLGLPAGADVKILRLDELLVRLAEMDSRMARVVELRVFAGMKVEEVAHVLEVSLRTVGNDWKVAKMWLIQELVEGSGQ